MFKLHEVWSLSGKGIIYKHHSLIVLTMPDGIGNLSTSFRITDSLYVGTNWVINELNLEGLCLSYAWRSGMRRVIYQIKKRCVIRHGGQKN